VYIAIILKEVLNGLKYMHSLGKIHRDIKSANILLASTGEVKLADFGVVGQLSDDVKKRQTVVGTPYWMAPEVIQGEQYDSLADIWSLGITAMEMALGRPPLSNVEAMKVLFLIVKRPPPFLRGNFSEDLKEFVELCLQKDPADRPTANELLETRFIQDAKSTQFLTELMKTLKASKLAPTLDEPSESDIKGDSDDEFDFSTIKPLKKPAHNTQPLEEVKTEYSEYDESEEDDAEPDFGTIVRRPAPKKIEEELTIESPQPSPKAGPEESQSSEPIYIYELPGKIKRLFEKIQEDYSDNRKLCDSLGKLRMQVEGLNDNYVTKSQEVTEAEQEIRKLKLKLNKYYAKQRRRKAGHSSHARRNEGHGSHHLDNVNKQAVPEQPQGHKRTDINSYK